LLGILVAFEAKTPKNLIALPESPFMAMNNRGRRNV
jgi:hypothetical protein